MATIDGKFDGVIVRKRDNKLEEEFVVFVPRDNMLVPLLHKYGQMCHEAGCCEEQVMAVGRLIARVESWREKNPDKCKLPDALPGECP